MQTMDSVIYGRLQEKTQSFLETQQVSSEKFLLRFHALHSSLLVLQLCVLPPAGKDPVFPRNTASFQ